MRYYPQTDEAKSVLSSQSETPLGANSAQVVSLTQRTSLGCCVSSPVHHRIRKAIQMSLGWGCQVTPQNKIKSNP